MVGADQPQTVRDAAKRPDADADDPAQSYRPASGWAMFGTGVAIGLIAALSMIAAISMIYPSTAP